MNKSIIPAAAIIMAAIGSCTSPTHNFCQLQQLPDEGWAYGDTAIFVNSDSMPANGTLTVAVRHNNHYLYRNLWLEVSRRCGNDTIRDTVNMPLSDIYGRWLGKGFGASYQQESDVAHDIRIDSGQTVNVRHIMRLDTLRDIEQIGVAIVNRQEQR